MPHMLAADGEREVTENKKVVVPGPKSGDHHFEKMKGREQKPPRGPPANKNGQELISNRIR
ncbi:hypothetical protein ABWI13_11580, partial [Streptomyces koyangensis]|uniref:hypothetical protein n=1 Tax=Streptomyces koyangensis TaxID=188770 RepID=UPI003399027E